MATDAQKFMVIDAHVDEESGSILIDGFEPITETGGTLNLMYKVYNPEPKPHFEDDAERKETCVKALEETLRQTLTLLLQTHPSWLDLSSRAIQVTSVSI